MIPPVYATIGDRDVTLGDDWSASSIANGGYQHFQATIDARTPAVSARGDRTLGDRLAGHLSVIQRGDIYRSFF